MKNVLFAAAALATVMGTPALAADIALKAPPPPPAPVCAWCGWYIGLNAGGTWFNDNSVDTTTTNVSSIPGLGLNGNIGAAVAAQGTGSVSPGNGAFLGGAQIGYNRQYNNWVLGIEADFDGVAKRNRQGVLANAGFVPGSSLGPGPGGTFSSAGTITSSKNLYSLGTLRGRLGVLSTPTLLAYGTGGLAYGQVNTSTTIAETLGFPDTPLPFGTAGSVSTWRAGWTAGGGLEWLFAPKWSVKVEYLYYDLGRVTNNLPQINQFGIFGTTLETVSNSQSTTRFNGSIVRIGINTHFN